MNKIKWILLLVGFSLIHVQCTDFPDPDPPSTGEDEMRELVLYSQYQAAMFLGGDFSRFSSIWMQQLSGVRGIHLGVENYNPGSIGFDDSWRHFYQELIQSYNMIDYFASELDAPVFKGIALIQRGYFLGLFTDAWGDVPFVESYKYFGSGGNPVYDSQEELYEMIFRMLDEGISLLDNPPEGSMVPLPTEDIFYGGSLEDWQKAARLMKLKFSLRLGNRLGDYAQSLSLIEEGGLFFTREDDWKFPFSTFSNLENPWYRFDFVVGNTRVGEHMVEMLIDTEDPRLTRFVRLNTQNQYLGAAPGSENFNASRIANSGGSIGGKSSSLTILSYCEQKFIEAEIYFRHGMRSQADEAYKEAVTASLAMFDARNAAWEEIHADKKDVDLEDIINAKYIALFLNPEVWTDWRRTGYPELDPTPGNFNEDKLPRHYLYPQSEETNNAANYPNDVDLNTRVWWDANGS